MYKCFPQIWDVLSIISLNKLCLLPLLFFWNPNYSNMFFLIESDSTHRLLKNLSSRSSFDWIVFIPILQVIYFFHLVCLDTDAIFFILHFIHWFFSAPVSIWLFLTISISLIMNGFYSLILFLISLNCLWIFLSLSEFFNSYFDFIS